MEEKTMTVEQKNALDKVTKGLNKLGGVFGVLCMISIPTAFLLWIWVGFGVFIKTILTSLVLFLMNKGLTATVTNVKESVKDVKVVE